jgi:hypothetical protein
MRKLTGAFCVFANAPKNDSAMDQQFSFKKGAQFKLPCIIARH